MWILKPDKNMLIIISEHFLDYLIRKGKEIIVEVTHIQKRINT